MLESESAYVKLPLLPPPPPQKKRPPLIIFVLQTATPTILSPSAERDAVIE